MRNGWDAAIWGRGVLVLVLLPIGTNVLASEMSSGRVWAAVAIFLLTVPLIVLDGVLRRREADLVRGFDTADQVANTLADAVLDREKKQRTMLLAGDVKAAPVRFERERELVRYRDAGGRQAGDLSTILAYYRELRPGRLVILGAPGSGKTVLALELLIGLLQDRAGTGADTAAGGDTGTGTSTGTGGGPVPLRIGLAGWDPARPLEDWLEENLTEVYRVSRQVARTLVRGRRILPVLDGLDEMDRDGAFPERAKAALESLNGYVDASALAPVVLTCRESCYQRLRQAGVSLLDATSVYIEPLHAAQIGGYLRARLRSRYDEMAWQPVLDELARAPHGVLAGGLSTPWRLAMATAASRAGDQPAGLLRHASREELDAHLLARFVPAVTRSYPKPGRGGPCRYDPERVTAWLTRLARHLDRQSQAGRSGTDLVLHRLWPVAGTARVRCLHVAVVALGVLAFSDFVVGPIDQLLLVYAAVIMAGTLVIGAGRGRAPKRVDFRRLLSWRGMRHAGAGLTLGVPIGLGMGVVFAFAYALAMEGLRADLFYQLPQGFLLGLGFGPALGIALRLNSGMSGALTPRDPLRNDLRFGLVSGLLFWLGYGLLFWPVYQLASRFSATFGFDFLYMTSARGQPISFEQVYAKYGLAYGLSSGTMAELLAGMDGYALLVTACGAIEAMVFGLAFGSAAWTRYALAVGLAARRRALPWRLGSFLDWACHAGLLRVSGTAYQFRHLELQHWLATRPAVSPAARPRPSAERNARDRYGA